MNQRTLSTVFFGILAVLVLATLYVWKTENNWVPTDGTNTWDTSSSTVAEFRYPDDLDTDYVLPAEWPPRLNVADGSYACPDAGTEVDGARIEERKVLNILFCISTRNEGAAGSTYTDYTYTYEEEERGKIVSLLFSTRTPQCLNYDGSKQKRCIEDQAVFNMDNFIVRIIKTLTLR